MNFMLFIGLHWVGDFLFQSTAMATNKHHSWRWLGLHILAYSIVLMTGDVNMPACSGELRSLMCLVRIWLV